MASEINKESNRRSFVSRLRERSGDTRPHLVVCGADPLVFTLAEELANAGQGVRLTVIVPPDLRADVPDFAELRGRGVRVLEAARLDERTFREAGLSGATALALVMPDDMVNLHAALCARAVEDDLLLVIRMFNTGLGYAVRRLFADCAVLSDAEMAAPAFVAAALGEVAPSHFRHAGRTLHVARRGDVPPETVLLALTTTGARGQVRLLPADPGAGEARPSDMVLAEATGRPAGQALAARRLARRGRARRPMIGMGRAVRAGLSRKLGVAVLVTLGLMVVAGTFLARFTETDGIWQSIYLTMLTVVGSSDVEMQRQWAAQAAQVVLTVGGVALLPLITAAVVDGVVKTRLALHRGGTRGVHADHIVLVGLGNVGTRVLRRLLDLGLDVVAVDRKGDAPGVAVAERHGVPVIVGDASQEETLRSAAVDTCRALVVLSTDDAVNLQAALLARAARPELRVVLRLLDDDFARRVQDAFNINISRSVSRLCAPAFAAAMLERDVLATIPVERHALLVATVTVATGGALDGAPLAAADRPESVRVIGMSAAGDDWVDWSPDPRRVLAAGDRVVVVARRAGLRVLLQQALEDPRLDPAGQ